MTQTSSSVNTPSVGTPAPGGVSTPINPPVAPQQSAAPVPGLPAPPTQEFVTKTDFERFTADIMSKLNQPVTQLQSPEDQAPLTRESLKQWLGAEVQSVLRPLVVTPMRDSLISALNVDAVQRATIEQMADHALNTGFARNMTEAVQIAARQVIGSPQQSPAGNVSPAQEQRRQGRRTSESTPEQTAQADQDAADETVFRTHGI